MQNQSDDRGTDTIENGNDRLKRAKMDVESPQGRHYQEVRKNKPPSAGPSSPEPCAQVGYKDADLNGKWPGERLTDRDHFAHLILGEPAALRDQLALHLTHEGYRSTKA